VPLYPEEVVLKRKDKAATLLECLEIHSLTKVQRFHWVPEKQESHGLNDKGSSP
jgi:hypothetical protein